MREHGYLEIPDKGATFLIGEVVLAWLLTTASQS
jgi:hypothetical protein